MRIGDLAAATGVNRRLLRYYEQQGLVHPRRDANGYRVYDAGDVARVRHIRVLLAAGLPTAVMSEILQCVHDDGPRVVPRACPGVLDQLDREHARLTAAIDRLQHTRSRLTTLIDATREDQGSVESAPSR